mmetsp:Transcript_25354/g.73215  ORF Transcript_25354/g.73215 Transcript_25354/m.73215 type:complete len:151 (+) Transcript_25354:718-1170(+)
MHLLKLFIKLFLESFRAHEGQQRYLVGRQLQERLVLPLLQSGVVEVEGIVPSHTHTHTYPSLTADDPCAWVGRDRSTNERALLQDADEVIQLLSSSERPAAGPSRALEDIPGPLRYLQQPETPPRRPSDRSGAGARDFAAFTFGGPPVLQ